MTPPKSEHTDSDPRILKALRDVWGYDTLRPLQAEAMTAGLGRRDSLVVMPTGGGKSLCYQVPPMVAGRTDVVVSPLIALMKDQVDSLCQLGYPAAALHSNLTEAQRDQIRQGMMTGKYRLIYVAPERLLAPWFLQILQRMGICAFAIDEAHCISQWGHDFRPEYRQLAVLRERFPSASIHAYTATATPRVREDIVEQLKLRDPLVLVGTFDRPNLTYRVLPLVDRQKQIIEALRRHPGEAAIVYCLSRKETESLAAALREHKIKAEHYHAGMEADDRRRTQERFASEQTDVIVGTIAFGMGIDRGNVRAVIHACLPKSMEHYQQETGRAGRDGLPAECALLYSVGDVMRLERLLQKSAKDAPDPQAAAANLPVQMELLKRMHKYAATAVCRHKALSEYFGQPYTKPSCDACDVCRNEVEGVDDATVIAQKILSCVARVEQRFGMNHVTEVLVGAETERIQRLGHDKLSTYGLLRDTPRKTVQSYILQLLDQGSLARTQGDMPVLVLNDASWEILRGKRKVLLAQPKKDIGTKRRSRQAGQSLRMLDDLDSALLEDEDRDLFDHLRQVRRQIAAEQGVPPYVVFHDQTLIEIAQLRPTDLDRLKTVYGIGSRKCAAYGERFIGEILAYCRQHGLPTDVRRRW